MAAPLEFTVTWEAWYAPSIRAAKAKAPEQFEADDPAREVNLQCIRPDHVSSYASFEERRIGTRTSVLLIMHADGWAILGDHPSLWSRLAARLHEPCTLEDVVALLAEYGATDVTPRTHACSTTHTTKD